MVAADPSPVTCHSSPHVVVVLHVFHKSEWAGAAVSAWETVRRMDHRRYRVIAVVPEEGQLAQRLRDIEAEVWIDGAVGMSRWAWLMWWRWRVLARRARQAGVALVDVNYHATALVGVWLAQRLGVPVVARVRVIPWLSWSERWALRQATRVVCVSETVRRAVLRSRRSDGLLGLDALRCLVLGDGRELGRFQSAQANGLCQEFGWPEGTPLVGIVGSLEPNKRQDFFLQVAAEVARQESRARFLIVGDSNMEKHRWFKAHLSALSERLGLGDRVVLTGQRQDVPRVMKALAVCMLLSWRDACPGVLIEAMAAGAPIVASPAGGGARELVGMDGAGIVLESEDPREYAAAVVTLLRDPARRQAMGALGRLRAERYDVASATKKLERIYEELLEQKADASRKLQAASTSKRHNRSSS